MRFLRFAIAATLCILPSAVGTAVATCTAPTDLVTSLDDANVVFVGEVIGVEDQSRIAEFRVLSVWKGPELDERIEIRGTPQAGAPVHPDDGRFTVGRTYLVIPENGRAPFLASRCSATRPFTTTAHAIPVVSQNAVGAEVGRAPLPGPDTTDTTDHGGVGTTQVVTAGIVLSVLAASGLSLRNRRPAQQDQSSSSPLPGDFERPRVQRQHRPVRRPRHEAVRKAREQTIAKNRERSARK